MCVFLESERHPHLHSVFCGAHILIRISQIGVEPSSGGTDHTYLWELPFCLQDEQATSVYMAVPPQ